MPHRMHAIRLHVSCVMADQRSPVLTDPHGVSHGHPALNRAAKHVLSGDPRMSSPQPSLRSIHLGHLGHLDQLRRPCSSTADWLAGHMARYFTSTLPVNIVKAPKVGADSGLPAGWQAARAPYPGNVSTTHDPPTPAKRGTCSPSLRHPLHPSGHPRGVMFALPLFGPAYQSLRFPASLLGQLSYSNCQSHAGVKTSRH